MNDLSSFEIRAGHNSNKRYYDGSIQNYGLTNRLDFYGFKLKCIHDFNVNLESEKDSAIYICINLAEKASLKLTCDNNNITIPPFASLLVPFRNAKNMSFRCKSNKDYNFLALKVHRSHLDSEQLELLQNLQQDDVFLNPSCSHKILIPNLAICEFARKLKRLDKDSCENKLIARGYSNILIGMKVKEFLAEPSSLSNHLRSHEIQQLELITDKIKENPENQYNIDGLCKSTGLSVSKLQAGFKEMHDCTVAIFIRNMRLEKALNMLKDTNLNVSEIVYSVGLSSRSYFCRIFKNRFKCSPKLYQQKLRESNPMAS